MRKVLLTKGPGVDRANHGDNCLQGHHARCKEKASYFPSGAHRLAKCSCRCHRSREPNAETALRYLLNRTLWMHDAEEQFHLRGYACIIRRELRKVK